MMGTFQAGSAGISGCKLFRFRNYGFDTSEDKFEAAFQKYFEHGLDVDDTPKMLGLLQDVVYIADNCGEIFFDTLVFDVIKKLGGRITLVVRGGPILTDVTLEEVKEFEIDKKVDRILTTGSNAVGVLIEEAPPELLEAMKNSTLIISKGMANYELFPSITSGLLICFYEMRMCGR